MDLQMEASVENIGPGRKKNHWKNKECGPTKKIKCSLRFFSIFLGRGNINPGAQVKPALFTAVERVLQMKLPDCGLKSHPHIRSRMKTLKVSFNIVRGMLFGKTDGFSWDSERRRVVAAKPVSDAYLRSHRNASKFKGKSFPYYEELCTIFGVNCTNGDCAGDHKDNDEDDGDEEEVEEGEVDTEAAQKEVVAVEKIDHQVSISISRSPALASNDEAKSKPKKRKTGEISDELVEVIR